MGRSLKGASGEDLPIETCNSEEPKLNRSSQIALEYLVDCLDKEHGLKNGKTALYWHLYSTIQPHLATEGE